jgi:transposase InsO family protein
MAPCCHRKTTRQDKRNTAAPDLVDRKFTRAQAPNRLWVADFSYICTVQGVLYLATVLDVFSRKIVGWHGGDMAAAGGDMAAATTVARTAKNPVSVQDLDLSTA